MTAAGVTELLFLWQEKLENLLKEQFVRYGQNFSF